jgi:hypothetical protein
MEQVVQQSPPIRVQVEHSVTDFAERLVGFVAEVISRMRSIAGVKSVYIRPERGVMTITTVTEGDWFEREIEDQVYAQEYELLRLFSDLPITFEYTPEELAKQGAIPGDSCRLL